VNQGRMPAGRWAPVSELYGAPRLQALGRVYIFYTPSHYQERAAPASELVGVSEAHLYLHRLGTVVLDHHRGYLPW
jgi:hypothetical protein